ncbi:hypothetical protein E2C01_052650 [Portunus trituberculatus]|uniref:Reverse transcriptase zinc-binding domain-containing protein n=1 Tax=Portunus trituberculatus TaxID=210409 RepID=A0A5B7GMC9_PORTR|nr:hypothetical protein [Portunus trituberculatus]
MNPNMTVEAPKQNPSIHHPNMTVQPVYKTRSFVPDYKGESFTRLRLMSHNLRVEVGRWSRTLREQRVCQCDGMQVQTEKHVLIECPLSAHCRDRYQMLTFTDLGELLQESNYLNEVCGWLHQRCTKHLLRLSYLYWCM